MSCTPDIRARKVAASKTCEECGERFKPRSNRQRWCGLQCSGKQRRHLVNPCKNPKCERKTSNGSYCSRCAARIARNGTLELLPPRPRLPHITPDGYVRIFVGHGHPVSNATGYAYVHRKVMAEHLGRPLYKFETVHHRNGNRQDNRLANLELWAKPQLAGQRVADLVAFVAEFYPDEVKRALEERERCVDVVHA